VIAAVVNKSTRWLVSVPEVREVPQLRGQAIAINSMGDGLHNSGTLAVTHFGLDPHSDVSWIAVGATPERLLTLQQGAAAATVVNAADVARAQALGLVPLLRLDDVAPLPESGLAASVAKLEGEREQVKRVLRAMVRALQFVKADREGSLPAFMEFLQTTREDAARDYDAIMPSYSDDGTLSERSMRYTIEAERDQLKVAEEVPVSRVASFEPLYETLAELGITPAPGSAR
jgi:ABC-type nitrate/sulfonate/bicarbonate transport system substrate-binding protein